MKQKRILTIQDYSCLGRCSLTVALPVISACGIECVGIPTAVLSNHTAGFASWTYADLTEYLLPTVDHWQDYNHEFDAIYTGYLGTDQISIVFEIIHRLAKEGTTVLVDPAFADSGKLYPGFDHRHVEMMKRLVGESDIVVPNLTEACFLLGKDSEGHYGRKDFEGFLIGLTDLGPEEAVLSGLSFDNDEVGCLMYSKKTGRFSSYMTESYRGAYHGTGDLFASSLVAAKVSGFSLEEAVCIAHDFVHLSIGKTLEDKEPDLYYGVEFEKALPALVQAVVSKGTKG